MARETTERNARIERLHYLVPMTVECFTRYLPAWILPEDLESAGNLGLVKAIDSYDPTRGMSLKSWAIERIRREIREQLRAQDTLSRALRRRAARYAAAVRTLERRGLPATDSAVAQVLGIEETEGRGLRQAAAVGAAQTPLLIVEERPPPREGADPFSGAVRHIARETLKGAIGALPEREARVLALYYYQGQSAPEIASALRVTRVRVQQLLAQGVARLRLRLGHLAPLFES